MYLYYKIKKIIIGRNQNKSLINHYVIETLTEYEILNHFYGDIYIYIYPLLLHYNM